MFTENTAEPSKRTIDITIKHVTWNFRPDTNYKNAFWLFGFKSY